MISTTEIKEAIAAIPYPHNVPREQYTAAHREYRQKVREVEAQWSEWMHDVHSSHWASKAQHDIIFAQAWSDSHSEGYRAVEDRYTEMVDMVERVMNA